MPGRILSKANEAKLRDAIDKLKGMLSWLDDDPAADDEAESRATDSDEVKEARRILSEAANLGNWLESRVHLSFTQIADEMFGGGRLNREERIGLSSAIGEALSAFNLVIASNMPHLYERSPWADAAAPMTEAALAPDTIPLVEGAIRADGSALIKLIKPGWGSSGYYGREVLQRDGPRVFPKSTKMFWNHPTASEEAQRPEGDLNNLAAELISDARYLVGPAGEGLYADAKVFGPYQNAVSELSPHIGVSIRASGRAKQGEAEGRKGPIVEEITRASSADFVTVAGAGGEIVQMFEAARASSHAPQERASSRAIDEEAIEPIEETQMTEEQLKEAIDAALAPALADNARLREGLTLRDAKDQVRLQLAGTTLPDVTKARLLERLATNPPVKDGQLDSALLTERVTAAVADEAQYLAQAAGYGSGRIEGMGGSAPAPDPKQQEATASLAESLQRLGIGKDMATQVADGWN